MPNLDLANILMVGQDGQSDQRLSPKKMSRLALALLILSLGEDEDDEEKEPTNPIEQPEVRVVDRAIPYP